VRTLIVSRSRGVFLEVSPSGLVFSGAPNVPYRVARTFADVIDVRRFIARNHDGEDADRRFPSDLSFLPVTTNWQYASMDDCVAAGLARWAVTNEQPFVLRGMARIAPAPDAMRPATFASISSSKPVGMGATMVVGPVSSGKTCLVPEILAALKKA
jgi:hypothetical protein